MQNNNYEPFCKIFLDTNFNRSYVLESIKQVIGGELGKFSSLVTAHCKLEVLRNDDFHEHKRNESPDGFLFSRFLIEIEPNEDVNQEIYVRTLSHLLQGLWEEGYKAIASCDFEDMLPNKGGYVTDNR